MVTAIFDTEKGPNLVRENVLLTSWLATIQPIRVSVKATDDTLFRVKDVLHLSVGNGELKCKGGFRSRTETVDQNGPWKGDYRQECTRIETKKRRII